MGEGWVHSLKRFVCQTRLLRTRRFFFLLERVFGAPKSTGHSGIARPHQKPYLPTRAQFFNSLSMGYISIKPEPTVSVKKTLQNNWLLPLVKSFFSYHAMISGLNKRMVLCEREFSKGSSLRVTKLTSTNASIGAQLATPSALPNTQDNRRQSSSGGCAG